MAFGKRVVKAATDVKEVFYQVGADAQGNLYFKVSGMYVDSIGEEIDRLSFNMGSELSVAQRNSLSNFHAFVVTKLKAETL